MDWLGGFHALGVGCLFVVFGFVDGSGIFRGHKETEFIGFAIRFKLELLSEVALIY